MHKKLKVYAVSVMAFMSTDDALSLSFITEAMTDGEITYIEQLPALIPAYSIDEASEQSKTFALGRWKVSEGWYGHQAAIMPVTKDFYEKAINCYNEGGVDMTDDTETGQCFNF